MLGRVVPERERLALVPDDTAARVHEKERALARLDESTGALGRWRRAADVWCAGWFWPDAGRPAPRLLAHAVDACRGRDSGLPRAQLEAWLGVVADAAASHRFFHWPLEFPEVFATEDGRKRDGGGFDAVVGNPPWDVVRADRGNLDERDGVRWLTARLTRFVRDSGVFTGAVDGHTNQYQLFVERALQLLRPGGRLGLVVPWGLAADHGSRHLRRRLLERSDTDTLVALDNRHAIFPIHRSVRFALVTATTGGPTRSIACRLGVVDPASLDSLPDSGSPALAFPVRFTPALLKRISGESLALPYVIRDVDLALLERLVSTHPALADPGGWTVSFGRELNASDDRRHFTTDAGGLPVVEGKHLSPFRVETNRAKRFLPRAVASRLLDETRAFGRSRLAYRDVASSTNRLTLIAAVVPAGVVTVHTVFCLKARLPEAAQWVLCALLNSFVANYVVRLRVTTHVTAGVMKSLPVPRPTEGSDAWRDLERGARRLATGSPAPHAHAALQARVARLYDLSRVEFAAVLESLPLVDRHLRAASLAAFDGDTPAS